MKMISRTTELPPCKKDIIQTCLMNYQYRLSGNPIKIQVHSGNILKSRVLNLTTKITSRFIKYHLDEKILLRSIRRVFNIDDLTTPLKVIGTEMTFTYIWYSG